MTVIAVRHWTEIRNREIVNGYEAGTPMTELGRRHYVSRSRIAQIIKAALHHRMGRGRPSTRPWNALLHAGIVQSEDEHSGDDYVVLKDRIRQMKDHELLSIKNIGKVSLKELRGWSQEEPNA